MKLIRFLAEWKRSSKCTSTSTRRPARFTRPTVERLEDRCLLSGGIYEFPIPTPKSAPVGITTGPDHQLWFCELFGNKIGQVNTSGVVTQEIPLPTPASYPLLIVTGPDNNLWFTEGGSNKIGRLSTGGSLTEFVSPTANCDPYGLTVGPDGNLWFTEAMGNKIGRITPAGSFSEFSIPTASSGLFYIALGPDKNLWFTEELSNKIGRITPSGQITEFTVPTAGSQPTGITAGPDGNIWFTEEVANRIGRITPAGVFLPEYQVPTANSSPLAIIEGPDQNIWFHEFLGSNIARITSAGTITEFATPTPSTPSALTVGPDGNIWFTEVYSCDQLGELVLDKPLTATNKVVTVPEDTAFSTAIASFSDADPSATVSSFTASIAWGDGSTSAGTISTDRLSGFDVSGTHSYAEEGSYSATVTITDVDTSHDVGQYTALATSTAVVTADGSLQLAALPTSATAGSSASFTVTALDPSGNSDPDYNGTVHFISSDGQAVLPADYAFTTSDAGVHSFSATLKTAGSQSLTAADKANAAIAGTQTGIAVAAATTHTLLVTGLPATSTAGTAGNVTVTAEDAFGNTASSYRSTAHFTSTDPQAALPADSTFSSSDAGAHSFGVVFKTAGTQSLTATDTGTSHMAGTETGITIGAAAVARFQVAGFAASIAGGIGQVTVTAEDSFGNPVPGYRGTVHFSSSDTQAILPADYTFLSSDNGVHTFAVTLKTAGSQTITASDTVSPGMTGAEAGIAISPAAASNLLVTGFPASITAGMPSNVTVTAVDPYGNVATGYRSTVSLTSSDGQAALPAPYTFTAADAGTHLLSATLQTAGNQSLSATDNGPSPLAATQTGITVAAAAATTFIVDGFPAAVLAESAGTVTVTAEDGYGNHANGYGGTIHFSSSDGQAILPSDYTFSSGDAGSHSFSVALATAGTQSITAQDRRTSSILGTQTGIAVSNPLPTSDSLLPSSIPEGSAAGTLIINGAGFVPVSMVQWNGTALATTFVSSTQLQASVPAAKLVEGGSFTIQVSSNGPGGGTSNAQTFTVPDAPLTATGTSLSLGEGTTFTGPVATFTDASSASGVYTATITWGDGHKSAGTIQATGPGAFGVWGTNNYAEEGSYSIQVAIQDAGGAAVLTTSTVSVFDVPLTASGMTLISTQGSASGGPVALFTDPGSTGTATNYTALITWGDGHTSPGSITANGGGSFTVSGSTIYAAEGPYSVSIHITDAGGSAITTASVVHVARSGPLPTNLSAVSLGLTKSAEYYSSVVTGAYQRYLQRNPDAIGLAFWVSRLQSGLTDEQLEAGFIGSPEYIQNHGGTRAGWVVGLYHDLLGRAPDAAGLNNWLSQLNQGATPYSIALGFAAGAEREAIRVTADYQRYLGRAPSVDEVAYWVDQFVNHGQTNEDLIAGFVGSVEYFYRHYGNVPDYLQSVYADVLNRSPDAAGVDHWVSALGGSN
jgi:streptogramin lyase